MSEEDDIDLKPDVLFSKLEKWKREDSERGSSAGETRQEIGQFLDDTGLNKKALAQVRALDKMQPEKREDALRSLDLLLDTMKPHWTGQSTPDMFEGDGPGEGDDTVTPFDPDEETAEFDAACEEAGVEAAE